jgi:ATP-grasp ribosomal peptide maturase
MILILTQEVDPHADYVIEEINRRILPVVRFHTSDFPQTATLEARHINGWSTLLRTRSRTVDLAEVSAIWYRRPTRFEVAPTLTPGERRFALSEATMGVGGLLRSADCLWVNHPEKAVAAEHKPLQLEVAARNGLRTPRSLITNDPDAFLAFCKEVGPGIIFKTLSSEAIDKSDGLYVVYTRLVDTDMAEELAPRVRHTACFFQEYIPKKLELRVTVVGNRTFCVSIDSQASDDTNVDWRRDILKCRHKVFELPEDTRRRCVALVRDLGLSFGAIDLVLTPGDELVFLEINQGGQWAWLEHETGVPIRDALIDLLVRGRAELVGP